MKLSKTGWNNVIIFVVMGFILIINITNKQLFPGDDASHSNEEYFIVGENSVILTLALDQTLLIERIGQTWRATPPEINGQALEQMMMSWHQAMGVIAEPLVEPQASPSFSVQLSVAGTSKPILLSVYVLSEQLTVFNHNDNRWISLPLALYRQLLPRILFAE